MRRTHQRQRCGERIRMLRSRSQASSRRRSPRRGTRQRLRGYIRHAKHIAVLEVIAGIIEKTDDMRSLIHESQYADTSYHTI